jgi:hypothetical protein
VARNVGAAKSAGIDAILFESPEKLAEDLSARGIPACGRMPASPRAADAAIGGARRMDAVNGLAMAGPTPLP